MIHAEDGADDLVFEAHNVHHRNCGAPPRLVKGEAYTGYFENACGEQWVVEIDSQAKTGVLRGGDVDWDTRVPIRDGVLDSDVILGEEERQWLDACWRAATGEPLKHPSPEEIAEYVKRHLSGQDDSTE
jgi:hypothetical protein